MKLSITASDGRYCKLFACPNFLLIHQTILENFGTEPKLDNFRYVGFSVRPENISSEQVFLPARKNETSGNKIQSTFRRAATLSTFFVFSENFPEL